MSAIFFHAILPRFDSVWPIPSHIHRPKLIPYWHQVRTRQLRKLHMFFARKSKSPRRFLDIDPDCLHTCCMSPCQALDDSFFCLCVPAKPLTKVLFTYAFFGRKFGYPKTHAPPKKYLVRKETYLAKHTHSLTGWQGFIQHVCQISGSISKKLCRHYALNKFGAICLNQLVVPFRQKKKKKNALTDGLSQENNLPSIVCFFNRFRDVQTYTTGHLWDFAHRF